MREGDVFRSNGGSFVRVTSIVKIGADTRIYFEGPYGTKNSLVLQQFMGLYSPGGMHAQNPWRMKK